MSTLHGLLQEQHEFLRKLADRVSALETYLGLVPTDIERLLSNDSLQDTTLTIGEDAYRHIFGVDTIPAAPPPHAPAGAVEVPPPSANATTGSRTSAGRPEDPAPRCGESAAFSLPISQCCKQPAWYVAQAHEFYCSSCWGNQGHGFYDEHYDARLHVPQALLCEGCVEPTLSPSGICDACWTQGKDPPAPIGTLIEPGRRVAVLMRAGDVRGAKYLELEHDGRHRVKLDKAGIMSVEDGALQVLPVGWAIE